MIQVEYLQRLFDRFDELIAKWDAGEIPGHAIRFPVVCVSKEDVRHMKRHIYRYFEKKGLHRPQFRPLIETYYGYLFEVTFWGKRD
jgi:hypothetical protein